MNIVLLHYSAWPEIGGVENVVRDQANMLVNAGHSVRILAGDGRDTGDGAEFVPIPQLASDFELNQSVRAVLDRGQGDQRYGQYRAVLVEALGAALADVDVTLVHNIFTMHYNLACTQALHDLAPTHPMVAWTHDLVAGNPDHALPNPTQPPWNLMRTACPSAVYVASSARLASELKTHLKLPAMPEVIPDMVDPMRLFGLTREMRTLLLPLEIPWRDFVFLLPAQIMVRKNIDFALEAMKLLCGQGRNPLLLITGAKVANSPASQHYGDFLRQSIPPELEAHVVFLSDHFPVTDEVLRDLYLLSDCLILPSRQEGFGLPVLEAAMHRMPVWCNDVPAFRALEGSGSFLFNDLARLPEAVTWLESQSTFRQQRRCRRLFDPIILYSKSYEQLLSALAPVTLANPGA